MDLECTEKDQRIFAEGTILRGISYLTLGVTGRLTPSFCLVNTILVAYDKNFKTLFASW